MEQYKVLGATLLLFASMNLCVLETITPNEEVISTIGKALSIDWHYKSHREPPQQETIEFAQTLETWNGEEVRIVKFYAYGKLWTLRMQVNTMLFGINATFQQRTPEGREVISTKGPRDCYYIGTAHADQSETGLAALTLCNENVRGLILTNINDYAILPRRSSGDNSRRHSRSSADTYTIEVADLTKYEEKLRDMMKAYEKPFPMRGNGSSTRSKRDASQSGSADRPGGPKIAPLKPPAGRALFMEMGLFFDKSYIDDFRTLVSTEPSELVIHAAELMNHAQLWYLHATLGYQIWLTIRSAIFIYDDLPLKLDADTTTYPHAACKWLTKTFPDQERQWDQVMIFSSKPGIWHGRVGLAQRAGVCLSHGLERCAGVDPLNFQSASLARLVAHEGAHPIGLDDDYDKPNSIFCKTGIMNRGVWENKDWSICSTQALERWAGIDQAACLRRENTYLPLNVKPPLIPLNVAWRAEATQSSTLKNVTKWGAWKATDGSVTGVHKRKPEYGSCTHTVKENNPWIRIELAEEYSRTPISSIVIYNRPDCCSERLHNLEVRVGPYPEIEYNEICDYYHGEVPGGELGVAVIHCNQTMNGRYVSVQIKDNDSILTVCEVQVFQDIRPAPFNLYAHECRDRHGFCPYWHSVKTCKDKTQRSFMKMNCPYSCDYCERPSQERRPLDAPSRQSMRYTVAPCKDEMAHCPHLAANGACHVNRDTASRCRFSCNMCDRSTLPPYNPDLVVIGGRKRITTSPDTGYEPVVLQANRPPPTYPPRRTTTEHMSTQTDTTTVTAEPATESTTPAYTTPTTTTVAPTAPLQYIECVDETPSCEAWAAAGACADSAATARRCPVSCGLCADGCSDRRPSCYLVANERSCRRDTSVRRQCPLSCKSCPGVTVIAPTVSARTVSPPTTPLDITPLRTTPAYTTPLPTTQTTPTSSPQPSTPDPSCRDKRRACPAWARGTYCSQSSAVTNCPLSCQLCPTGVTLDASSCADRTTSCRVWARRGKCTRPAVANVCQQTCGVCSTTPAPTTTPADVSQPSLITRRVSCRNSRNERTCKAWADGGFCYNNQVAKLCRKSCNTCPTIETVSYTEDANTLGSSEGQGASGDPACQPDTRSACTSWKDSGHCSRNVVKRYCPTSCGC